MKKSIIFLIAIFVWFEVVAQNIDYNSFAEEGKVWNMLYNNEEDILSPDFEFCYFIKGDTLISDLNCKKLYSYNENNTNQTKYKMALYEINKKVYFIPDGSETSHLLYDFGIPVGSSVYTADVIHPEWELEMKNTSDRIVKTGEISRHCLLVNRISFPSGWWIEGIGSELGPLNTWGFEAAGNSVFLLNCAINGQVVFSLSDFKEKATGINEMKNERVKSEKYDDVIYDLSGRKINSQFSIFNSQFPKGLYIVNGRKIAVK